MAYDSLIIFEVFLRVEFMRNTMAEYQVHSAVECKDKNVLYAFNRTN